VASESEIARIREIVWPVRSPTVVELGAREGEDEEWIRASFREDVHYVMVEADIRNCQVILDKGVHRTRRLIVGAVADHDGNIEFYGSVDNGKARGSGSIRQPTKHLIAFPEIRFPPELHTFIPCYTLNTIFDAEWLTKIDLLWVDIQGAERDMVRSGGKALAHTRYLFIETEEQELYEGMATKPELLQMLPEWELIEDFGCNCLLRNRKFNERGPR
jgi:FkbM family methyltransferase